MAIEYVLGLRCGDAVQPLSMPAPDAESEHHVRLRHPRKRARLVHAFRS